MTGDQQLTEHLLDEPYRVLRLLAGPRAAVRRRLSLAWRRRLAILVGGCVGSGLRIAVGTFPVDPGGWPWATLSVNLTGALLLGYLLVRFQQAATSTVLTIPLLCVGVLGSYTTFSALSAETWQLAATGETAMAVGYATTSLLAGLLAAVAGIRLAERRP